MPFQGSSSLWLCTARAKVCVNGLGAPTGSRSWGDPGTMLFPCSCHIAELRAPDKLVAEGYEIHISSPLFPSRAAGFSPHR